MTSHFIDCHNSTRLHYLQEGPLSVSPIIFLHGLGGSTKTFEALRPRLSGSHNLISLDFPGFGKSPPLASRPKIREYVANLHDLITSLQITPDSGGKAPKVGVFLLLMQNYLVFPPRHIRILEWHSHQTTFCRLFS
jgi:pimeloyl-ACP methyl ester carboxylesterase